MKRVDHSNHVCVSCGRIGDYKARGQCQNCYIQDWREANPNQTRNIKEAICTSCQVFGKIHAKGLCDNCYRRAKYATNHPIRNRVGRPVTDHSETVCVLCGNKGDYHAKGKCKTCYYEEYQQQLSPEVLARRVQATEAWNKANKERHNHNKQKSNLKKLYNITPEDYELMLKAQNDVCATCKRPDPGGRRLGVDHNHKTGKVRGLLCTRCNFLIGHIEELGPEITELAKQYISSEV